MAVISDYRCYCPDEAALATVARRVASCLQAGDVLALNGPLGAGKTFFTQAAARELGVVEQLSSPTFVLLNLYQGRLPVAHADLYRLDDPEMALGLGLEDFIPASVTFVEWPEKAPHYLPSDCITVKLDYQESGRSFYITGRYDWAGLLG